jgi:hypothetical protein
LAAWLGSFSRDLPLEGVPERSRLTFD